MGAVALQRLVTRGNFWTAGGGEQYVDDRFNNKSGQVFKAGELVAIDATPEVLRVTDVVGGGDDRLDVSALASLYAGTTPNIAEIMTLATSIKRIYGIAMKDAPASGQIKIPVAVIYPGTIVEGNLVTGGSGGDGDVLGTARAQVAADLLRPVALIFDDTNDRWYFTDQIVTTAERCADVVKIALGVGGGGTQDPYGAIGDTNARVQCTFRASVLRTMLPTTGAGTT